MGFQTLLTVPDLSKATVSVFFRIPQSSADETLADSSAPGYGARVLDGVVPIIMFGPQQMGPDGNGNMSPMQPSCIGVDFNETSTLHVHLQTAVPIPPASGGFPDYYGNSDEFSSGSGAGHPGPVDPDLWHHVMLSWDCPAMMMWCAIDGVDKSGADLPAMSDDGLGGPSGHQSVSEYRNMDSANIPASAVIVSSPLSVPGPATLQRQTDPSGGTTTINGARKIELAELQIFAGVTTSTFSMFIDANGKPISPSDPNGSIALLGKQPDIALIGSQNWIAGTNTGSSGGASGTNFTPTGVIKAYTPNAALGS